MVKMLVDGVWRADDTVTRDAEGRFARPSTQFRSWITPDGAAGPTGDVGYRAERGRYHLYVSLACPWAHRTLIFRKLKGLEDVVSVSVTHWFWGDEGWTFAPGPRVTPDPVFGADKLYQVYATALAGYTGRCSVPVLLDKATRTIVSNESSEIIRMFNSAFDGVGARTGDFYPAPLRGEIDAVNARVYETLNNGVYRCALAANQTVYEDATRALFATLDWLEERLATRAFLVGDAPTEADWRLFTTLLRFDPVYYSLFRCNWRRIADYPRLSTLLERLVRVPGVAETVDLAHIKGHYYTTFTQRVSPSVVPIGPKPPAWAVELGLATDAL
jgi:putative glutathione S-transferase